MRTGAILARGGRAYPVLGERASPDECATRPDAGGDEREEQFDADRLGRRLECGHRAAPSQLETLGTHEFGGHRTHDEAEQQTDHGHDEETDDPDELVDHMFSVQEDVRELNRQYIYDHFVL